MQWSLVWGGVGALTRPIFLSQTKREGKWWMASPVSCQGLLALRWMELQRQRHSPKSSQGFLRVFKSRRSYLKRNSGRGHRLQPPLLFPQGRELIYGDGIVTSCELVIKMFLPGLRLFSFSWKFVFKMKCAPDFYPLFHKHRRTKEELLGNRKEQKKKKKFLFMLQN